MAYEPVYQGLATQQPNFGIDSGDLADNEPVNNNEIVLISAMIVVVGVVFIFVARAYFAETIYEGPVLVVHPDSSADTPQIENIIHAIKTLVPVPQE